MPNTRRNPRDPDSPFITREGMRNAVPFKQRFPNVDFSDVKAVMVPDEEDARLQKTSRMTNVPLATDIVRKLRATGPEWPELADKILRDGLKKMKQKAA